jgi:hypothetical protein
MQACFFGFAAVVDEGEEDNAPRLERSLKACDGLLHAVNAGYGHDAMVWDLAWGLLHEALLEDVPMGCGGLAVVAETF